MIRWRAIQVYLQRVPEALQTFDDLPTCRGTLVRTPELELQSAADNQDETAGTEATVHARPDCASVWDPPQWSTRIDLPVAGLVLGPEDGAADDTTDASSADERGGAERTLPLPSDVVRLIS